MVERRTMGVIAMTCPGTCGDCGFWRPGAPADMTMEAPETSAEHVGACEWMPPCVAIINDGPVTLQPTTHYSRCCSNWLPDYPDDDGPGDGMPAPVPVPDPDRAKVRRLFPNPPPQPIAA